LHIPNAIDDQQWHPLDQEFARDALGLPRDRPLVLFVAMGGLADPRKGADLLVEAMQYLRQQLPAELVLVGGQPLQELPFPCHNLGSVQDDRLLKLAYAASDLLALPSRLDNLPNTALEAQMCGRPVVAFNSSGTAETVEPGLTGALAEGLDPKAFAHAILDVLQSQTPELITHNCRKRAIELWCPSVVANAHKNMYQELMTEK
jgi:glycosyltransferase involved in cell wall biosynthesis